MRSFALKAAIAAILVSTSFVAVRAESMGTAAPKSEPSQTDSEYDASPLIDQEMITGSIKAPAPVVKHQMRNINYRPRLNSIVEKVNATNHRIHVDHSRGYLSKAEYKRLQARAHDIQLDATRVAEKHRGALPKASYVAFESRLARLNHAIRHEATT